MQTTTFHFIRHGEVENPNHVVYERLSNFHLSQRGNRMAEATAQFIASNEQMVQSSVLFSSPLERTIETAAHIEKAVDNYRAREGKENIGLITDTRLIEASNEFRGKRVGHGEGALWKNGNWRLVLNPRRPSWGESYEHIAARMSDFVYEKTDEYAGESLIVVSHESPIWTLRTFLTTGNAVSNVWSRKTALASVTSLVLEVGTHKLLAVSYADPAAGVL